jgi:hypothetical protein
LLVWVLFVGGTGAVVALAAYLFWIRPWQLTWGASDSEVAREMPGDDFVEGPTFNATRAVTIRAPAELIWPWLLQMGHKRAGWYSYDWIDNLGRRSAERIIPELQELKKGDLIPLSPNGKIGFRVQAIVPNEHMIWGDPGSMSWVWYLEPEGDQDTRLISRVRVKYRWCHPSILFHLCLDVGDIVMMRKCMLGIKRRAESLARDEREVVS